MELTIKDVPKEIADEIIKEARKHPRYVSLAQKKAAFIASGNYMHAMQTAETMKKLEELCIKECLNNLCKEVVPLNELTEAMSEEDRDQMYTLGNLLTMLADMIDSAVMESNAMLHKYWPDCQIEMFDKLVQLGKEAKRHLLLLDSQTPTQFYQNTYGDMTDKLYEMSVNKARSFVNKLKKHAESVNKKAARNAKVA